MNNTKKKLLVIDGNAIIHRAYHALPPLTSKKGEIVNAVYGFSSTLLSVMENFKPDYVIASFDLAGPTFRHEKFEAYKAHRVKADDELYAQIPLVKEVVKAFGIPIYEKEGFEADDVIGTIINQSEKSYDVENIIVTGDLDTLQLVSENTKVYTLRRGISDAVTYGIKEVWDRFTLRPDQLIDYKGLRGDPSDNIPGVKGVGEKTAISLLKQFETLENVYAHINEIKGATKDKLERDKANAFLSRDLATIEQNCPIKLELEKAKINEYDRNKLVKLFQELSFFSLIKRLPSKKETQETNNKIVADHKQEKIENENLPSFIDELLTQKECAISIETVNGNIVGYGFSYKTGRSFYVTHTPEALNELMPFFSNESIRKIGYDMKSSYKILKNQNIKLKGVYFDVMLAAYVLDPGKNISFEHLVLTNLGEEVENSPKNKKQLTILDSRSDEEIINSTCQKVSYVYKLKSILEDKIKKLSADQIEKTENENTVKTLFENIEMPLIEILAEMEMKGIKINTTIFQNISEKISKKIQGLENSIYEISQENFNINSTQQLSQILFSKLAIPTDGIKKTKTGFSTASPELEKIRTAHPIIEKIEEYRELFKLKTTYIDTLPTLVDQNYRIHTTFNQAITATGRLSSTDPNLQNIPIKTDLGKLLRTAFEAEKGHVLISADYSQIDLRAVAHVSGDKKMIEAFHRGDDIHLLTAAEINKVSPSQVTKSMRRKAKELNFGIIYGMGAYGFSLSAGISRDEAKKFINTYMEKFSGVAQYMKETKEFAHSYEFVETMLGRRRTISEINSANFQIANGAERMAINMPIQGLAADIMKISMIKAQEVVDKFKEKAHAILQVHDEIIFEVKSDIAKEFSNEIKNAMEGAIKLKVPLVVDVTIGKNWGEL